MSTVNGVNQTNVFDQINDENKNKSIQTSSNEQSEMFMQLMIAQLKNQSPTSPAETTDFMQQISSMSTVESIANLNTTVEQMSNSLLGSQAALQASSMVGQKAFVKTDVAALGESKQIDGVARLPVSSTDVRVKVYDAAGTVVDQLNLGPLGQGDHNFTWEGNDFPQADYRIETEIRVGNEYETVDSYLGYTVNSVTLGQNGIGMRVNTDAGAVGINDVIQLGQG